MQSKFHDVVILLRAIRWYNVLFLIIAQYLTAICIFNTDIPVLQVLSNYKLHIITLATAFSVSGAFIINGFYDVEKDMINIPDRVIFNRLLSTDILLNTYVVLSAISVFIALFAGLKIFIFFAIMVAVYWFYSHKLSHIPFIREVSASLLSILCFISIWLHYGAIFHAPFFVYLLAILAVLFSREIIKDLLGQKGNAIFGYKTVVETTSPKFALRAWLFFSILSICAALIGMLFMHASLGYFSSISLFGLLGTVFISLGCNASPQLSFYNISDQLLRGILVIMVLSTVFLRIGF